MDIQLPLAIRQTEAHPGMSSKYDLINTERVLNVLLRERFILTNAVQTKVRLQSKQGFQKHMMCLTRDDLLIKGLGQIKIACKNAHEGSSSLHILGAMDVFLCANGMFRCTNKVGGDIRVRHMGFSEEKLLEALQQFMEGLPGFREEISDFNEHHLTRSQQEEFALTALEMKYDKEHFELDPTQFLKRNRVNDSTETLWGTLNVVQENLIKGHGVIRPKFIDVEPLQLTRRQQLAKIYGVKSRAVTAIDKNVDLNKKLWSLAVETLN